jgi:hypothetical protein
MIVLSCDLCDQPDDDSTVTTVAFAYANRGYELDLCPTHTGQVQDSLTGWAAKGRPARTAPRRRPRRQPAAAGARRRTATTTEQIRRWARQHGHQIPDRGPLPAALIAEYNAAATAGLATGVGVEV